MLFACRAVLWSARGGTYESFGIYRGSMVFTYVLARNIMQVIEGLVEVWPVELCDSALISFSFLGASMVSADLEQWLLKVIKATDANEDDVSEETSKEQLRKMLDDMKAGGRGGMGGRGRRGGRGANDAPKEKKKGGFGR